MQVNRITNDPLSVEIRIFKLQLLQPSMQSRSSSCSFVTQVMYPLFHSEQGHIWINLLCSFIVIWVKHCSGQSGAIRHGISKALQLFDPNLRPALKSGTTNVFSFAINLSFFVSTFAVNFSSKLIILSVSMRVMFCASPQLFNLGPWFCLQQLAC